MQGQLAAAVVQAVDGVMRCRTVRRDPACAGLSAVLFFAACPEFTKRLVKPLYAALSCALLRRVSSR